MKTIEEIKAEIDRVAAVLDVEASLYPDYAPVCAGLEPPGYDDMSDGRDRISVDADGYHYEARRADRRWHSTDFDDVLDWAFSDAIHELTLRYEREHRVPGQAIGRLQNQKRIELFALVSPGCLKRCVDEIYKNVQRFSFDDDERVRVYRYRELVDQGLSREAAWQAAVEAFPPTEFTTAYPSDVWD